VAVAINPLKRFVADYEMNTGKHITPYKAPDNGQKIALIGGGAEGLTASYYLARLGYQTTIFEGKPELGGVLRYVIAQDRLPSKVLDHDINGILKMGVEAKTGMLMGRDFTVEGLLGEGYEAVGLTSGGFDSRKILHPDLVRYQAPVEGLYTLLDFLVLSAQGETVETGRKVIIVSSGLKSLEVARKCRELTAEKVTIVSDQPSAVLPLELLDAKGLSREGIDVR